MKRILKKQSLPALIGWVAIANFAGIIGSLFTVTNDGSWYAELIKPAFQPPNFIFGPVWTILYALMGISAYMIWRENTKKKKVKKALTFFWIQLGLNSLWSILFFGLQNPEAALLDIIVLWVFILLTICKFKDISKPAAWLLAPYLLWVTFATYLNLMIVLLN